MLFQFPRISGLKLTKNAADELLYVSEMKFHLTTHPTDIYVWSIERLMNFSLGEGIESRWKWKCQIDSLTYRC